jgi:hypothetical protein
MGARRGEAIADKANGCGRLWVRPPPPLSHTHTPTCVHREEGRGGDGRPLPAPCQERSVNGRTGHLHLWAIQLPSRFGRIEGCYASGDQWAMARLAFKSRGEGISV